MKNEENEEFTEKCKHCDWEGTFEELGCDRGGHNFLCPNCEKEI